MPNVQSNRRIFGRVFRRADLNALSGRSYAAVVALRGAAAFALSFVIVLGASV